jgi:hypothetical protein
VPDGSVLARAVHTLKYQEQCIPVRGVMKLLQGTEFRHVLFQKI